MTDIVERLKDAENATHALFNHIFQDAREEIERLRAKIERMEKQEPIGWVTEDYQADKSATTYNYEIAERWRNKGWPVSNLYTLPGAQPAPSVPAGWLRAIDEELVATHIGVANAKDTYEQARQKLKSLISWHVAVATDPAVNGGFKLVQEVKP